MQATVYRLILICVDDGLHRLNQGTVGINITLPPLAQYWFHFLHPSSKNAITVFTHRFSVIVYGCPWLHTFVFFEFGGRRELSACVVCCLGSCRYGSISRDRFLSLVSVFRLQPPAASRNEFFIVGACYYVTVGLTTTYVGVCLFGAVGGGGRGAIKDALEGPAVHFYVHPETNGNRKNKNLSSFSSSFCGCCCWGGGGGGGCTYHIR